MMQITQQFGALYKLIQHILPSNMCWTCSHLHQTWDKLLWIRGL